MAGPPPKDGATALAGLCAPTRPLPRLLGCPLLGCPPPPLGPTAAPPKERPRPTNRCSTTTMAGGRPTARPDAQHQHSALTDRRTHLRPRRPNFVPLYRLVDDAHSPGLRRLLSITPQRPTPCFLCVSVPAGLRPLPLYAFRRLCMLLCQSRSPRLDCSIDPLTYPPLDTPYPPLASRPSQKNMHVNQLKITWQRKRMSVGGRLPGGLGMPSRCVARCSGPGARSLAALQPHQSSAASGGCKNSRLPALPTTRVPEGGGCGASAPQHARGHSTRSTLRSAGRVVAAVHSAEWEQMT